MANQNEMRKEGNVKRQKTKRYFGIFLCLVVCIVVLAISMQGIKQIIPKNAEKSMQLTIQNKAKNSANYHNVTSTDGITVPVPTGYRASDVEAERSVNGGFVIYEGENEPVPTDETGLMQAQINRNQWVWIPISSTEFSNMYHTSGNKIYGNYYDYSSTSTFPTLYTSSTREPALTSYDKDSTYLKQYLNGIEQSDFKVQMEQRFYEMLQSVKTYGGFYISRYEISDLNQNIPSSKRLHSNINNCLWFKMYEKCKELKGANEAVDTNMIWGIQFDETLKFLISTGCKTYDEIAKDSTSWGNYYNATFTYYTNNTGTSTNTKNANSTISTSYLRSGITDYAKANNIFDLAGNVFEWTMEADGSSSRYKRGGYYDVNGTYFPAKYRISNTTFSSTYYGCRATLYIE